MLNQKQNVQSLHSIVLPEEDLVGYRNEFNLALSDPDITNIAVSGPFGAGKSTVVDSWESSIVRKGHPSRWIHVSLAEFQGEQDRNIEGELINQLVHKLGNDSAPKTRFAVTRDAPVKIDLLKSIFITSFIALSIVLFWQDDTFPWMTSPLFFFLTRGTWGAFLAVIVYQIIRRNRISRTFKRLKFLNAEVEMFDASSSKETFDRYMDDIVYLLSATDTEVVVFEDLDRFGDVSIFEKLWRANDLANARRRDMDQKHGAASKKKPLRFIYLVRDGIFADPKDRTKFFDLIIPVIPYVDPNNSLDVLKKSLEGTGVQPTDEFLYQLSLYVDDPRILKDICNESQHYKIELLGADCCSETHTEFWSDDCLVAMMAYKALFPDDFERLQTRDGYVFSRFQKKRKLIDATRQNKELEIDGLEKELEEIEQRTKLSASELTLLYLNMEGNARHQLAQKVGYRNFNTVEEFSSSIDSIISGDASLRQAVDFLKHPIKGNRDYLERLGEVEKQGESRSALVQAKISQLEEEIIDLERKSLKDLFASGADIDEFLLSDDGTQSSLVDSHYFQMLRFLLVQGYINECYQLYISNRYNGSLTPKDEEFLYSLLGGFRTSVSQKLDNPASVVLRLLPATLAKSNARNWSIFKSLSTDGSGYNGKLTSFVRGIQFDHDACFVCSYVLSDLCVEASIAALVANYSECFKDILLDERVGDDDRRAFCHKVIGFRSALPLISAAEDSLQSYASNDDKFLVLEPTFDKSRTPMIEWVLDKIGYEAQSIDFSDSDIDLLKHVADKGMFAPTVSNVLGLTCAMTGADVSACDLNSWLASEDGDGCASFRNHILENKDAYILSLIDFLPEGIGLHDNDRAVAMILNGRPLSKDSLNKYVSLLAGKVSDLSLVDGGDARSELVGEMCCADTPGNIAAYLEKPGFDDILATFLESEGVPEGLTQEFLEIRDINSAGFIRECAASRILSKDTLDEVARKYRGTIDDIRFDGLTDDRIKILIDAGIISVTESNLLSLRKHQGLVPLFASKDLVSYVAFVVPIDKAPCDFLNDEVLELLGMPGLASDLLVQLAENLEDDTPLSSSYPDDVNIVLLSKKGPRSSIDELPHIFVNAGVTLRRAIANKTTEKFSELSDIPIGDGLEMAVAKRLGDNPDQAKQFINSRMEFSQTNISREHLRELFKLSNLMEYVRLLDGPSARIEETREDDKLIHSLQTIGMCGSLGNAGKDGKILAHSKGFKRSGGSVRKAGVINP